MKLFAPLIALAAAQDENIVVLGTPDWPGLDDDHFTCGTKWTGNRAVVNSSCAIDFGGSEPKYVFLGGGAFITGQHTFTGYDGVTSDDVDIVVFWKEDYNTDGELDNKTCGEAALMDVTCVDTGEPIAAGPYFMETTNDHRRAKEDNWNIQIYPAGRTELSLTLVDIDGNPVGVNNMTCDGWAIAEDSVTVNDWGYHDDDGVWSISQNADDSGLTQGGDIVQCFVKQQPGQNEVINFWLSSVA